MAMLANLLHFVADFHKKILSADHFRRNIIITFLISVTKLQRTL